MANWIKAIYFVVILAWVIYVLSDDAEADDARVEVVDQYVVIRETHEFPIVGEWTRDRRKFLKCEIRIHVPAGSIAQGEYDIS